MHRSTLLNQISDYRADHRDEDETVKRFRDFVQDHDDCFERSQLLGHVTGSAFIVDPAAGLTLLTHHRKLGIWLQLGGHADGAPDTLRVARREAEEESGLPPTAFSVLDEAIFDLDIHPIPARDDVPEHLHHDVRYLLAADSTLPLQVSSESIDLAWVPLDGLGEKGCDESVLRMARKWAARGKTS